jgi:hypothetical protein
MMACDSGACFVSDEIHIILSSFFCLKTSGFRNRFLFCFPEKRPDPFFRSSASSLSQARLRWG